MKTIAFFNNKGGVGKTSLVYHLAHMYAELDLPVVAADLDPQANLTAMFLEEERVQELWPEQEESRQTVFGALRPLLGGTGDVVAPHVERITDELGLVVGDLQLSSAEDELSNQWPQCMDGRERAFRVLSALPRILAMAAAEAEAGLVLIDVGPNVGALNRAALVAADHVVVPLAPDLYSLQGLRNLGPTLRRWRGEWRERRERKPLAIRDLELPAGEMAPLGYVVMQHAVRLDRPVKAYQRWMERIPNAYSTAVLEKKRSRRTAIERDRHCLATLKNFRSLMPLAQEARKPMFSLRSADGALGGHAKAVQGCYGDFRALARTIAAKAGLALPRSRELHSF